jgi:hypothetical protein
MAEETPTLRSKMPAIVASAMAVAGTTFALSYLGLVGTMLGIVAGSLLTGSCTVLYERWIRRSRSAALKYREHMQEHDGRHRDIPWRTIAVTASVIAILAVAGLAVAYVLARRPVLQAVTGDTGPVRHHAPATGGPPATSPSARPSASLSVSPSPSPSPDPSPSASLSPSPSPDPQEASPSASVTPSTQETLQP